MASDDDDEGEEEDDDDRAPRKFTFTDDDGYEVLVKDDTFLQGLVGNREFIWETEDDLTGSYVDAYNSSQDEIEEAIKPDIAEARFRKRKEEAEDE